MTDISRREFVRDGVLAGVAAGAARERAAAQAPAVVTRSSRPIVIASGNGNRFRNGGTATCVEEAFRLFGVIPFGFRLAGHGLAYSSPARPLSFDNEEKGELWIFGGKPCPRSPPAGLCVAPLSDKFFRR